MLTLKRTNNNSPNRVGHDSYIHKNSFDTYELSPKRQALKITCIYFAIGSLWILLSDKLVEFLIKGRSMILVISIVKGWIYVFITSVLIFSLVFTAMKKVTDSKDKIKIMNDELEEKVLERTAQLEETNAMLEDEIVKHQKSEDDVKKLNNELESKVLMRTSQLEEKNGILDKSNTLFLAILESSPQVIVFALDSNYCYLAFNKRHKDTIQQILGKEIKIGMNKLDVIGRHKDRSKAKANFDRALAGKSFSLIEEYGNEKLSRFFWESYYSPVLSNDGKVVGLTCFVLNITERVQAEEALKESERRLIAAQSMAYVGNWELNLDTKTIWASEETFNIYGIEYITQYLPLELIDEIVFPEYRESMNNALVGLITKKEKYDQEFIIKNAKTGEGHFVHSKAILLVDEAGNATKVIGTLQDITERKEKEKEIIYLSYHDKLTGLYNRRFYEEEIKRLDTVRNLPISIIIGDVNGLKLLNDAFGHDKGDELLQKAAASIQSACRTDDIVARWGGDEFVILLPRTNPEEVKTIIQRIKELYSNQQVNALGVSISFGWDTKRETDEDILRVLKSAEDYMYKHKILENEGMRGNTISTIINTLHEKNPREEQHSKRVSEICQKIGIAKGLSEIKISKLKVVGLLHDIGKIAIEEGILNKPGKLSEQELYEIKRHPDIGYRILSSSREMLELAEGVLAHHEKWDGTGYPKGLKGEAIPTVARIISLADSYDAMTSERPYRNPLSEEEVLSEIRKNAGTQFDPEIARIFIEKVLNKRWD